MSGILWVAAGSAIGGAARYGVGVALTPWTGPRLLVATLAVNVLGSFLIGYLATLTASEGRWPLPPELRLFLSTGLLGGFTTFSAFSLQTIVLLQEGLALRALAYVLASVLLCLLGAWLGLFLGR